MLCIAMLWGGINGWQIGWRLRMDEGGNDWVSMTLLQPPSTCN